MCVLNWTVGHSRALIQTDGKKNRSKKSETELFKGQINIICL